MLRNMLIRWMIGVSLLLLMPARGLAADALFTYTKKELEKAIAEKIESDYGLERPRATLLGEMGEMVFRDAQPIQADIAITDVQEAMGRVIARVTFNQARSIAVEARYEEWTELPVAARRITGRDPITEADLTTAEFPKRRLSRETLASAGDIIGKAPRRSIPAGRPIQQADVMEPLLVRADEPVTMLYETPHIQLKMQGIAMQGGPKGARIGVRNADSGTTVYGVVAASGTVMVAPRQTRALAHK